MKTHLLIRRITVAGVAVLAACAPQPQPPKLQVSASIPSESSLSGQVLHGVNSDRSRIGASAARERYQMQKVSANVAAANRPGKSFAPVIVNLWVGYKSHESNMRQSWTHTGVATLSNSQLATRDQFNRF